TVRVDHLVDTAAGDDDDDVLLHDAYDVPVGIRVSDREHAGRDPADHLPHPAPVLPRHPAVDLSEGRRARNALAAGARPAGVGRRHPRPGHRTIDQTIGVSRSAAALRILCREDDMRRILVLFILTLAAARSAAAQGSPGPSFSAGVDTPGGEVVAAVTLSQFP